METTGDLQHLPMFLAITTSVVAGMISNPPWQIAKVDPSHRFKYLDKSVFPRCLSLKQGVLTMLGISAGATVGGDTEFEDLAYKIEFHARGADKAMP